jgi:aspartate/methionine/tyrosine aminotransferase
MTSGDSGNLCDLLREKYETSVVPGKFFELPAHFRIGLGGETETLTEGLRRLGAALDELG